MLVYQRVFEEVFPIEHVGFFSQPCEVFGRAEKIYHSTHLLEDGYLYTNIHLPPRVIVTTSMKTTLGKK